MTESKKYWYIQLNVNFFEDERIDWLCEQKNGYAYVVLYLKLCLKTANNNGILTRKVGNMIIPYNVDKIAEITHINVDIVRVALELYKKIGLVYEADENCNFMRLPEVQGMVGCVTQAAVEKRKQRDRKHLLSGHCPGHCPDNVRDNVQQELRVKSKELIDNSLDIEIEINKEGERKRKRFTPPSIQDVFEYCNERNNGIDPEAFIDYYEARGWKYGQGKPVVDWKAAVRTWEKRAVKKKENDQPWKNDGYYTCDQGETL